MRKGWVEDGWMKMTVGPTPISSGDQASYERTPVRPSHTERAILPQLAFVHVGDVPARRSVLVGLEVLCRQPPGCCYTSRLLSQPRPIGSFKIPAGTAPTTSCTVCRLTTPVPEPCARVPFNSKLGMQMLSSLPGPGWRRWRTHCGRSAHSCDVSFPTSTTNAQSRSPLLQRADTLPLLSRACCTSEKNMTDAAFDQGQEAAGANKPSTCMHACIPHCRISGVDQPVPGLER